MIHVRDDGTYTVMVGRGPFRSVMAFTAYDLAEAKYLERALRIAMPPPGEQQQGPMFVTADSPVLA